MAASANPSGGNSNTNNGNSNGGGRQEKANGGAATSNGISVTENSVAGPTKPALRHNPGLSHDWTPEEQSILEDLLNKYASETIVVRYALISQALKDKTVRDIAFRCRWMNKKENGKRRKDDHNSSKKNKDKKEKVIDSLPKSSQVANRSSGPPYVQSMMSMDSDDGISYQENLDRPPPVVHSPHSPKQKKTAIGGATGQLLEQNAQALDQISSNFSAFKIHENINLFCQARSNIISILNDFNDMPEIMKQMPPLPVKLNEELAHSILPQTSMANKS